MVKTIFIVGLLSLVVAFNANAQDSDRIDRLEKEIQELKLRISKLESILRGPSSGQEIVLLNEGWKSVANWRKLSTGMGPSDVEKILGEPHRLDGGIAATWYYQNNGEVLFYREEVRRWTEPRK